jgi:hypothetical protein
MEISVLARAIDALHYQGYSDNFSLLGDKIVSGKSGKVFSSWQLTVDDILCCDEEGCEGFYIYALTDPQDQSKGILTIFLPPAHATKTKSPIVD